MTTLTNDFPTEYVKRDGVRIRLIRPNEVTLPQAGRILGLEFNAAKRFLRWKGIKHERALPDRMFVSETERVYPRDVIEDAAQDVKAYLDAKRAEEDARFAHNMRLAREAREQEAVENSKPQYVTLEEAAALLGRCKDDPLFDDEAGLPFILHETDHTPAARTASWIVVAAEPTVVGRLYAMDDLEAHIPKHIPKATAPRALALDNEDEDEDDEEPVGSMSDVMAAFCKRADIARSELARMGALCAA